MTIDCNCCCQTTARYLSTLPAVAEWLRRAYPALLEWDGVGSIPANSDAQHVPSFRRWRFEMKLSPFCLDEVIPAQKSVSNIMNHIYWKPRNETNFIVIYTCCHVFQMALRLLALQFLFASAGPGGADK